MKRKVDKHVISYVNLVVKGQPELVLNHFIIHKDVVNNQQLDHIVELSTALLKIKTVEWTAFVSRREIEGTKLQKEIDDLNKEMIDATKKRPSLFKELLHEHICKDCDQIVHDQGCNAAGYVLPGSVRVSAVKQGLTKDSMDSCV